MTRKTTPKNAITFIKVILALSFSWPLSKSASKFQITCFKILRSLFCMNTVVLSIPIAYTLYRNDYDLPRITKLWCTLGAMIQVSVEMTQCALQYDRLQYLISEMERTLERAELYEKNIYQRYIDRCAMFYMSSTAAVFLGAGIGVIVPLTAADQIFPTEAKYPFNVEHEPIKTIIFVHQFIAVWQCFSTVCIGSFISLFIWFAAARFEILSQQFRMVTDIYDITQCSLTDKIQFMALCISALMEVYACAWPADRLIDMSTNVAQAVYESLWYNQDKIFQKNLNFILLRSQIPTTICVSILPALSLQYYASYVSTAFSYLMTLRMVFMEEDSGIKN
ncbi:PREDICTED: uncharacterized protein LOC105622069 [Atta cephalotes]|uniref:Odorant receptor n=1 Tax=Atta cephalotes TaxID=12957 RepID=A0A158NMY6_ATTCE|nr:PREDICTED: uncharacterized protein LOC105622069 [Atta cephalotes]